MLLNPSVESIWRNTFPDKPRPQLYTARELNEDGCQTLTSVSDFLIDHVSKQKSVQLYALAANNQEALILAQQEWVALERLANRIKHHDASSLSQKEPQALPDARTFEEHKEAVLYGYKYEHKRKIMTGRGIGASDLSEQEKYDLREEPDPFAQGGFIPSDKQFKVLTAAAKAGENELNPDNFESYQRNFAYEPRPRSGIWIPKMLPYISDLPAHPKTRARTRQLNTYARSEATDLGDTNADKSASCWDSLDNTSRAGTPFAASPAIRKRKAESVASDTAPRKKHPNQYTKRREAVEAAAAAVLTSAASSRLHTVTMDAHAPALSISSEAPRKRHPNQHTKRREREAAERQRLVALHSGFEQPPPPPPPSSFPPQPRPGPHPPVTFQIQRQTPVCRTPSNPPDFVNMTIAEKLACQWDATSLVECVKHDHYWLHADPDMADRWKSKILAGDYPVRTLAMLRKWDYWQKEGTNKRPRNTAAAVNARTNDGTRHKTGSNTGERSSKRSRTVRASCVLVEADQPPVALINRHTTGDGDALQSSTTINGHNPKHDHTILPEARLVDRDEKASSADIEGTDKDVSAPRQLPSCATLDRNINGGDGDGDRDRKEVNGEHAAHDKTDECTPTALSHENGTNEYSGKLSPKVRMPGVSVVDVDVRI